MDPAPRGAEPSATARVKEIMSWCVCRTARPYARAAPWRRECAACPPRGSRPAPPMPRHTASSTSQPQLELVLLGPDAAHRRPRVARDHGSRPLPRRRRRYGTACPRSASTSAARYTPRATRDQRQHSPARGHQPSPRIAVPAWNTCTHRPTSSSRRWRPPVAAPRGSPATPTPRRTCAPSASAPRRVEPSFDHGCAGVDQTRVQQRHDQLCLRIAESTVELDHFRAATGQHQPGIQYPAIRRPSAAMPSSVGRRMVRWISSSSSCVA